MCTLHYIYGLPDAISYHKNMAKFVVSTHVSAGKSYFSRASSNIGETNLMIRIVSKAIMIKTCSYDQFFIIKRSMFLSSKPSHDA